MITFANSLNQIRPDKMSGLIWAQTFCHSDDIPERCFEIDDLEKICRQQNALKLHQACKELNPLTVL